MGVCYHVIIYVFAIVCLSTAAEIIPKSQETLILVHTLFRHGDRTNDKQTSYPTDPYKNETYYPYGWGQLTNEGKRTEYKLGQILRKRYINFLGEIWTPEVLDARSTDVNRTKMSAELVLAGLYPPVESQMFIPGLLWMPIPYNYVESSEDDLLQPTAACPKFQERFDEVQKSPEYLAEIEQHKSLFEYLSLYSGLNVTGYFDCLLLYNGLKTNEEIGKPLPDWSKSVYPDPLKELSVRALEITSYTKELKRTLSGALIKKMVDDTKAKIDGTLEPKERKLFLYSAHDTTIAYFLRALDIFEPFYPPYGSCVMVEVHKIRGELGVKIYYENYTKNSPKLLTLPGCSPFCKLDKFNAIASDVFPAVDSCK